MEEDHTVRNIAIVGGILAAAYFLTRPSQAAVVPPPEPQPPTEQPPQTFNVCTDTPLEGCTSMIGCGLIEIRAPVGSMYAARGPWGYITGTDSEGNPTMLPINSDGRACIRVNECIGGGSGVGTYGYFQITVQLPDGTTTTSQEFGLGKDKWNAEKNACYYLFETQSASGQSFAGAGYKGTGLSYKEFMRGVY